MRGERRILSSSLILDAGLRVHMVSQHMVRVIGWGAGWWLVAGTWGGGWGPAGDGVFRLNQSDGAGAER